MKMETITIPIYNYSELSEEVKQEVLNKFRYANVEDYWWNCILDDFVEICKQFSVQVKRDEIFFSGFYSQGDGSSFASCIYNFCDFIDAVHEKKWKEYAPKLDFDFSPCPVDRRVLKLINKGDINIISKTYNQHRYHYLHFKFDYEFYNNNHTEYSRIESEILKLEKWIEAVLNTLNGYLFKELEEEYDRLTEDESIIEYFEGNECKFTKKGFHINPILN